MELVPYLSAVILVATIATILLAVISYTAFKVRDQRRPGSRDETPVFFRRYRLGDEETDRLESEPEVHRKIQAEWEQARLRLHTGRRQIQQRLSPAEERRLRALGYVRPPRARALE